MNKTDYIELKSFTDNYRVISSLGVGSFGSVVLAKSLVDKTTMLLHNETMPGTLLEPLQESYNHNSLVAVKILNRKAASLQDYNRHKEVKFILSIPSHANLVQVYELFVDPKDLKLHVSMEALNQTLLQLINARKHMKFSQVTLKSLLSQILNGIRHIHRNDFFHRDIKPENILVIPTIQYYGSKANIPTHKSNDSYIVKIADYGLSRNVHNHAPYTAYISTRWYRSPEILLRRNFYSFPVDIWAYGVVAVELINFAPLFPGTTEIDQLARILQVLGCPSLPDVTTVPPNTNFFIPLGGFWREAQILGAKLGIRFPYKPGLEAKHIFPVTMYPELEAVVRACLTWDPDTRPEAESISTYDYFKDTTVYQKPTIADAALTKGVSSVFADNEPTYGCFYDDLNDGYESQFMENTYSPAESFLDAKADYVYQDSIDELLGENGGDNYTWNNHIPEDHPINELIPSGHSSLSVFDPDVSFNQSRVQV